MSKTKLLLIHGELSSLALLLGGFLEAALAGRPSLGSPVDGFAFALLLLLLLLVRPPANPPYPCNIRPDTSTECAVLGDRYQPPRANKREQKFYCCMN